MIWGSKKNVIERAMILTEQEFITPEQLPFEMRQFKKDGLHHPDFDPLAVPHELSLEEVEKVHVSNVLKKLDWNKSRAARILGISRATLREKIRRYHLSDN